MTISLKSKKIHFKDTPLILGIVNITPDSFYDGGKYNDPQMAVDHAMKMIDEGAEIIDLGAESSRPGSDPVPEEIELKRLIPVISGIREKTDIPISIDTYKPAVAIEAIKSGADIINDISSGSNEDMFGVAAKYATPIILMHMKGTPKTMQDEPNYENVIQEVTFYLRDRIESARKFGVKNIIVDPGIGFGKNLDHNMDLMSNIDYLREECGTPILLGASRKSFLDNLLQREKEDRLAGSLALVAWSVMKKVDIIRVHDVKETADVIRVISNLIKNVKIK